MPSRRAVDERPGPKRSNATLHGAGPDRLPQTSDRSKDRRSATQGVCARLRAVDWKSVMTGLVPAIHVFLARVQSRRGCPARGRILLFLLARQFHDFAPA